MRDVILLIDDSTLIHKLVKVFLSPPFDVISAYDGRSGLIAAAEHRPDLILLDVEMPDIRGYEVCRRLKADRGTHEIPVIFLTSASEISERAHGLEAGACDYIEKSFDPADFYARICAALGRPGMSSLEADASVASASVLTPNQRN